MACCGPFGDIGSGGAACTAQGGEEFVYRSLPVAYQHCITSDLASVKTNLPKVGS